MVLLTFLQCCSFLLPCFFFFRLLFFAAVFFVSFRTVYLLRSVLRSEIITFLLFLLPFTTAFHSLSFLFLSFLFSIKFSSVLTLPYPFSLPSILLFIISCFFSVTLCLTFTSYSYTVSVVFFSSSLVSRSSSSLSLFSLSYSLFFTIVLPHSWLVCLTQYARDWNY